MAKNKQIVFEMSAKIASSFTKGMKGGSKQFSDLAAQANELNKQQKNLGKFSELRSGLSKTRQDFNKAKSELVNLGQEMKLNPSKKLSKDYETAQKKVSRLAEQVAKKTEAYKKSNQALKKEGIITSKIAKEQGRLAEAYNKTMKAKKRSDKISAASSKMTGAGEKIKGNQSAGGLVAKTAVMGATMMIPIKFAADDEENLSDLKKIMKMDTDSFKIFRDELVKTTKQIPMTNKEIYDIGAAAGMAGIKQNELAQFTKDAAMMSKAFNIEASESGDTMATWRQAFKMNRDEVVNLMDQINYLGNEVNALPADMTRVVREIGTLGGIVGFTEAQTSALAASLISSGNGADVTKTAIKKLYTTLASGEGATKAQSAAYTKLGYDSAQVSKDMQKDAQGTMLGIMDSIKKLEKHEQTAVLKDLFGQESIGVLADLISNTELTGKLMDDMKNKAKYAGSSMKEYKIKTETLNAQTIVMNKQLKEAAIELGSGMIPIMKEFIPYVVEVANEVTKWAKENPELVKTMFKIGGSLIAANLAIGGLRLGVGNLLITGGKMVGLFGKIDAEMFKATGSVGKVIGGFAKFAKMGASFLVANPIVLALGAVAVAGYMIYKNWDMLKATFNELVEFASGKIDEWKENIKSFVAVGKENFLAFKESIVGSFVGLVDGVKDKWEGLKEYFKGFGTWFIEFGKNMVKKHPLYKMMSFGIDAGKGALEIGKGAWSKTKEFFGGGNAEHIPKYAKGGVVSSPQLAIVGEGGSNESIIPHDTSNRSKGLWEATGRALGVDNSSGDTNNTNNSNDNSKITVHYSPIFYGTPPEKKVQSDLENLVRRILGDIDRRNKRLAY